jgi:hypothetical protein
MQSMQFKSHEVVSSVHNDDSLTMADTRFVPWILRNIDVPRSNVFPPQCGWLCAIMN